MLNSIIDWSLRHRFLIIMATLLFVVGGISVWPLESRPEVFCLHSRIDP
jgi:hypothetical protein